MAGLSGVRDQLGGLVRILAVKALPEAATSRG